MRGEPGQNQTSSAMVAEPIILSKSERWDHPISMNIVLFQAPAS
jgi:hypothetical protein